MRIKAVLIDAKQYHLRRQSAGQRTERDSRGSIVQLQMKARHFADAQRTLMRTLSWATTTLLTFLAVG